MTDRAHPTPPDHGASGVTQLLLEWRDGDPEALDRLTPIVYEELRRLAHRWMRKESASDVLQTTALVHEAYLRLVGENVSWEGRDHFFAVAATVMRRILVEFARRRQAQKRGGGVEPLPLDEVRGGSWATVTATPDVEILALDEALRQLSAHDARKGRIVELHFFGGLTIPETAHVIGVSHATVERDLKMSRAWLSDAMNG